jgi:NitT/TauT family transport system ATP-binding protein
MRFGALEVIRDLTLTIESGEFVAVVGPSGCGKSTLLKLLSGLLQPDHGLITVEGEPPEMKPSGYFGFAFQRPMLLPWRTIQQNVHLPVQLLGGISDDSKSKIVFEKVGLKGFEKYYPLELSGGMQQRAALGMLLAHTPRLWLLDEPFSSLDELTRLKLSLELLPLWRDAKATVVFVTHDVEEAVLLASRIIVLSHRPSTVVASVPVRLADRTPETIYSAEFLETSKCVRSFLTA